MSQEPDHNGGVVHAPPSRNPAIRPLTSADLEAAVDIVALHDPSLRDAARAEIGDGLRNTSVGAEFFGVVSDDALVGLLGHVPDPWQVPDIRWLVWGYVHPDHRRSGLGDGLFSHVEERLRSLGCRKAYLDVGNAETHAIAIRFHEKRGYRLEGNLPDYWSDGEAFLVFGRRL